MTESHEAQETGAGRKENEREAQETLLEEFKTEVQLSIRAAYIQGSATGEQVARQHIKAQLESDAMKRVIENNLDALYRPSNCQTFEEGLDIFIEAIIEELGL